MTYYRHFRAKYHAPEARTANEISYVQGNAVQEFAVRLTGWISKRSRS